MPPDDSADAGSLTPSRRAFLTVSAVSAAAAVPLVSPGSAAAATTAAPAGATGPGRRVRPQAPDRELRAILAAVNQRRIEAIVRRLAAFGTRHTLSSQDDPVRGIGAARDWIYQQMLGYAAASGGQGGPRACVQGSPSWPHSHWAWC